jgi:hypothetical protein
VFECGVGRLHCFLNVSSAAHFFTLSPALQAGGSCLLLTRLYGSSGSTSLCYLIFNVADVGLERNQPSHIDQSIVSAAINISRSVFAPAAGNDLTD